jgi:hypothetical protein
MVERFSPGAPIVAAAGDEPRPWRLPEGQLPAEHSGSTATVEAIGGYEPEEVVEYPTPAGSGGDFAADVAWVYENYSGVVVLEPGRPPRCHFARATSPPPSGGAIGLMLWAADNRTAFFKDVAGKALTAERDEKKERIAEAEFQDEKIREILKRYKKIAEEKAKEEWM